MIRAEEVGGVHIKYLHHCHRQLWLFARGMRPEAFNHAVQRGEAVHETSYDRFHEVDLGAARLDHLDTDGWVREIKSSGRPSPADEAQAMHYCHHLQRVGVTVHGAVLHYPAIRRTVRIPYDTDHVAAAEHDIQLVVGVVGQSNPPGRLDRPRCTGCSYLDYWWTD